MEILNPAYLDTDPSSAPVTYDPKAETVNLPVGMVSVAGVTVVTGGVELSCGSCMLAFGFWGSLISLSCIAVEFGTRRATPGTGSLTCWLWAGDPGSQHAHVDVWWCFIS
ncbi:hypothetical protein WMY93_025954 [Mugilogobius chulae]|uniref:Uncharacterized protein n=1 Tax=Mugilogobius chulae TaxID=88201 RepID=A0AAW0N614_9GOBI